MGAESQFDDKKGRMKEAAGDVTGDEDLQREGKADQASGAVKEKVDQAKDKANDMVDKAKGAMGSDR